jgi:carbamoyltransferase
MKRHSYVLGTAVSHDGSSCLLKDGEICVAIEKERLTRLKHDGGNDTATIQYCLDAEGITIHDLDLIVQNANFGTFQYGSQYFRGHRLFSEEDEIPIVTISHHLAHAYSTIGTCPFDTFNVLVMDGCGNPYDECIDLDGANIPGQSELRLHPELYVEKDSYYRFNGAGCIPLIKDFSEWGYLFRDYPMHPRLSRHSIGGLYAAVSVYCFGSMDDPGKLMGLGPYGRPGRFREEIFEYRDGRVFVNYDWMEKYRHPARSYDDFKKGFQYYADIAFGVQQEVEKAILYIVSSRLEAHPAENLCYSGGTALNAVANAKIQDCCPIKNFYIEPAAGDNGLALGCAFYGWLGILKRERVRHNGSTCFGITYPASLIGEDLDSFIPAHDAGTGSVNQRGGRPGNRTRRMGEAGSPVAESAEANVAVASLVNYRISDDPVAETAKLLADGAIIGWFQGGSEFGPRALGHRSILADPRKPEVREFINARIKFREDFRPFAPSVLREDVGQYFKKARVSPYMILVDEVREEYKSLIAGVVHVNNTCRVQTVMADWNPIYYSLLQEFKKITGLSILLNTSFNRKGMPIVETPFDALDFFYSCQLDYLVMGNYIVSK